MDDIKTTPEAGEIVAAGPDLTQAFIEAAKMGPEGAETIARLQEVQIKQDEWSARKAFYAAMSDLHGRMGSVHKNQTATIKTRDGRTMQYRYADKHAIASAIRKAGAAALGLAWSWDYKDTEHGIEATCWAKHRDGHREGATWSSVKDGRDNPLTSNTQKKKILTTTAERVTLASAFGITDTEDDTDAPAFDDNSDVGQPNVITPQQAEYIKKGLEKIPDNEGYIKRLLSWADCPDIDHLPADLYKDAEGAIAKTIEGVQA